MYFYLILSLVITNFGHCLILNDTEVLSDLNLINNTLLLLTFHSSETPIEVRLKPYSGDIDPKILQRKCLLTGEVVVESVVKGSAIISNCGPEVVSLSVCQSITIIDSIVLLRTECFISLTESLISWTQLTIKRQTTSQFGWNAILGLGLWWPESFTTQKTLAFVPILLKVDHIICV